MIFYKYLFDHMDMLSIHEKIVYSTLVGYSIRISEEFCIDGHINSEYINQYVISNSNAKGYGRIPLVLSGLREMSRDFGISRTLLKRALDRFREIKLITSDTIVCHRNLFGLGYLTLPDNLGIRGQLLVFYAYLKYRSRLHGGVIDTWASRLEELTGIEKGSIYDMLYKLHKKGLVQRLPGNKLKIISIEDN